MNCPNGKWGNSTDYVCYVCTGGCLTCTDTGLDKCTVCGNVGNDTYYKHRDKNTCGTSCPGGQFISADVANICQACSPVCVTCELIAENCTSATCAHNLFFLNFSCLSPCPDNYFPNSSVRQCIQCQEGCQTCYGSGLEKCTKCNSVNGTLYYLQIGIDKCSLNCNVGEFKNSTTQKCVLCAPACAECTSLLVCQKCQSVYGAAYYLDVDKCTIACPTDEYGDLQNATCYPCAGGCRTCFGPSLFECTSCKVDANGDSNYLIYGTDI